MYSSIFFSILHKIMVFSQYFTVANFVCYFLCVNWTNSHHVMQYFRASRWASHQLLSLSTRPNEILRDLLFFYIKYLLTVYCKLFFVYTYSIVFLLIYITISCYILVIIESFMLLLKPFGFRAFFLWSFWLMATPQEFCGKISDQLSRCLSLSLSVIHSILVYFWSTVHQMIYLSRQHSNKSPLLPQFVLTSRLGSEQLQLPCLPPTWFTVTI